MSDAEQIRELLLGYLLEALDPADRAKLEERLANEPELRAELEHMRSSLEPLTLDEADYEPPPDLTERTAGRVLYLAQSGDAVEAPSARDSWRLTDWLAVGAVVLAAAMIIAPAVATARYRCGVMMCQSNLRDVGMALAQYQQANNGLFPLVKQSDRVAVAGMFAPLLVEQGYLEDPSVFRCPGTSRDCKWSIPTRSTLNSAPESRLPELQDNLSGDYGSSLGIWKNGQPVPVRDQGRANFALVADAPSRHLPGLQSANHAGRGQNVLFEALNVDFLPSPQPDPELDSIYSNRCGYVAPGITDDDAVIGRSGTPLMGYPPCPAPVPLFEPNSK